MDVSRKYCVYCHTLMVDGRKYIGITGQKPYDRWQRDGKGYHTTRRNSYFANAINKYGWNNFTHEILFEHLTKDEAIAKEKELIERFNTTDKRYGFNSTSGGEGAFEMNDVAREKISKAHKGKPANNRGKPHSKETLELLSKQKSIKCYCIETGEVFNSYKEVAEHLGITPFANKKLVTVAGGLHWCSYDDFINGKVDISNLSKTYKRKRYVLQIDKDMNVVGRYESVADANRDLGKNRNSVIAQVLHQKKKSAYGFYWCYEDEYDKFKNRNLENECYRKVAQYDLDGNYITSYKSLAEAGRVVSPNTKRANGTIYLACIGKCKTAFGYKWKYEEIA